MDPKMQALMSLLGGAKQAPMGPKQPPKPKAVKPTLPKKPIFQRPSTGSWGA